MTKDYTEKELRHELSNGGNINLEMVKGMMAALLEVIDQQTERIAFLERAAIDLERRIENI